MKKHTTLQISSVVAVVLVLFLLAGFLAADMIDAAGGTDIVLPTGPAVTTAADVRGEVWENSMELQGVAVTPENVADVVATLRRPDAYTLTAVVERSSGETTEQTRVTHAVAAGMSSTVSICADVSRHTLRDGERVYLWENSGKMTTLSEGSFGEDAAAGLPGYEIVHTLPSIKDAGYMVYEGFDCIYFTSVDAALSLESTYYVDIATGLLIASETICHGQSIYRMRTETIAVESPDAALFTLPDGRSLMS